MPQKIVMDERLFAHILLDPELSGRYDVEGNQFKTTLGYLNQYIDIYFNEQKQAFPEALQKMRQAIKPLLTFEEDIRIANSVDSVSREAIEIQATELNRLENKIVQAIERLKIGQYLLLPGGWANPSSPGHAMIYTVTKTKEGLLFFIYNSGAGIQYHEKTSSTINERYYPVRMHHIPKGYPPQEMKALVHRLMLAMLPSHLRSPITYDAACLYQDIDRSLIFLEAEPRKARQFISEELTTAGQLSGTCAQRVIHQMLKITFGNLKDYQNFAFQFKRHALREYTSQGIRSMNEPMIELVRLAINNVTKLLKQLDKKKINASLSELLELKKQFRFSPEPASSIHHKMPEWNDIDRPFTIKPNLPAYDDTVLNDLIRVRPYSPITPLNPADDLIPQLDALIATCEALQDKQPVFVIEQLEQAIASLPLPPHFDRQKLGHFNAWSAHTGTDENLRKMIGYLETLQSMYVIVCDRQYPNLRLPRQQIVHGILIGLRDFFHTLSEPAESEPHPHRRLLRYAFEACHRSPWISANDPLFDEKFNQLLALYSSESNTPDKNDWDMYIQHKYKALITPEEDAALIQIYEAWSRKTLSQEGDKPLRDKKLISLYTLFKLFKSDGKRNDDTWNSMKEALLPAQSLFILLELGIMNRFSKQLALELFITTSMNSFLSKKIDYHAPRIGIVSGRFGDDVKFLHSVHPFMYGLSHKYNHENSPEHKVLDQGIPGYRLMQTNSNTRHIHWSSNQIQLSAELICLNKDPFFVRDLLHLRTSSAHQIQLTLDYFKRLIDTLEDPNTQTYVEANIFERNHLSNLLDSDQDALLFQFDEFIQRGLQFYLSSQALMTQSSLFFIHLRFLFNDYLAQKNPVRASGRLKQDCDELTASINLPHNDEILSTLHQYRFLTAMKYHALHHDESEWQAFFAEALQSLFFIQRMSNPSRKNTSDITVQLERAQYHFQGWLEKTPDASLRDNIKLAIKTNGIDVIDSTLEGNYPHFYLRNQDKGIHYDIDVTNGLVFKDNRVLGMTPSTIKTHAIIQKLGLEQESLCFMSPDKTIFELITDQQQVRITTSPARQNWSALFNYRVEKKWSLAGLAPQWHQLCPLTEQQNSLLNLGDFNPSFIEHDLPAIFNDNRITVWINNSDQSVIIVQDEQPIFQSNAQRELEQLDEHGRRNGYILQRYQGAFADALANFEDSEALVSTKKRADPSQEDRWHIHLPRYGLFLETAGKQLRLGGTDYILTDKPSPFPTSVACLNVSNARDHRVIVALLPFQTNENVEPRQGGYYPLKHAIAKLTQNSWNDDPTEKYITYQLIDGQPTPDKPADALYLCYVYLANHQPEKAWAVLDDILGLEGHYQELVFLEWLVNKLPTAQDKAIKNPIYLACQLKALALFTDHLADDIKPAFPPENQESLEQTETRTFYTGLPKTIELLFTRFQNMERHLSHPYSLDNAARRSLLNTCLRLRLDDVNTIRIDNQFVLYGALGYQYRRLSLETVLKEKHHLEATEHTLKSNGMALPKKFASRLEEIKQTLDTELPVWKRETKLEKIALPKKSLLDADIFSDRPLSIATTSTQQAIKDLTSELEQYAFLNHIDSYLSIALNHSPTSSSYLALENFCIHCLRACANRSASLQQKRLENYAHCFYRLLNAPDSFKKRIKSNIEAANKPDSDSHFKLDHLFHELSSIQTKTIEVYQAKDVFQQILASNEVILADLARSMPMHKKMNLTPINRPSTQGTHSMAWFKDQLRQQLPGFSEFERPFNEAERDYQSTLQHQLDQLDQQDTSFKSRMQQEQISEANAGLIKFDCAQRQKSAATYFTNEETLATLKTLVNAFQTELNAASEKAWSKALSLANKPPEKPDSATLLELEKIAGLRRESLTQHDLLKLYFNAEESAYFEMTGLSSPQMTQLHNLIHQAVTQDLEDAHLQRLIKTLESAKPEDVIII